MIKDLVKTAIIDNAWAKDAWYQNYLQNKEDEKEKKNLLKKSDVWRQGIRRNCLKCDKSFMAQGRYLRFCPTCRNLNSTTYNCAETFNMVDNMRIESGSDLDYGFINNFQTNNSPPITI